MPSKTVLLLLLLLAQPVGAASYYFSDCPTGGAGTLANPYCLDPGSGNNPAGNESFDYLMDGSPPELAAGDTVYLCAGACDGQGTGTYHLMGHSAPHSPDETTVAVFDMEVSGTQAQPITIQPYCNAFGCETVILSGDTNGNYVYDSNEPMHMFNNADKDGSTYIGGHHWYRILGNPDGGPKNLIIERIAAGTAGCNGFGCIQSAFMVSRGATGWEIDGLEIRRLGAPFFPQTLPGDEGTKAVGCTNTTAGDFVFNINEMTGTIAIRNNLIHHVCGMVFRPINNCAGQNESCTGGQDYMYIENNTVFNAEAFLNGHQGRRWRIRGNYIYDTLYGIGIEEQVSDVIVEDNTVACAGIYNVNLAGTATKCKMAISVNDGDSPPSDGCADSGGSEGRCTTKDVIIRRNKVFGASYEGESGKGRGLLLGGIAFAAHNSFGDLGSSVVENNMVWHTQQSDDCNTDVMGFGRPVNMMESGIGIWTNDPLIVQNNTVYEAGCYGLFIGGGSHTVRNNLVLRSRNLASGCNVPELAVHSSGVGSTFSNNSFYDSAGNVAQYNSGTTGSCPTGTHSCGQIAGLLGASNQCVNANFVEVTSSDRTQWNPHLQTTSNASLVNGGTTGPADDIDKQSRLGAVDIGADEVGSADLTKPRAPTNLQVQ